MVEHKDKFGTIIKVGDKVIFPWGKRRLGYQTVEKLHPVMVEVSGGLHYPNQVVVYNKDVEK